MYKIIKYVYFKTFSELSQYFPEIYPKFIKKKLLKIIIFSKCFDKFLKVSLKFFITFTNVTKISCKFIRSFSANLL